MPGTARAMAVLILNPNSSSKVTAAIADAAKACHESGTYEVQQIDEAPTVIEDDGAVKLAAELVRERVRAQRGAFDAFVVACHADPGVRAAQQETGKPVSGIGAASFRAAVAHGGRFGVITLGPELVPRKWRQLEGCGLGSRCVAIEPSHSGVLDGVSTEAPDLTPYLEAGRSAIARGANVLVLGCAGMVRIATAIERELGVPVVEPVAAGIREATAAVRRRTGLGTRAVG